MKMQTVILYTSNAPFFKRLYLKNIFEESKLPFLCFLWY